MTTLGSQLVPLGGTVYYQGIAPRPIHQQPRRLQPTDQGNTPLDWLNRSLSGWGMGLTNVAEPIPIVVEVGDRARFEALAAQWRKDTAHLSSVAQLAMHPAYQRIIGLGERALPFLFQDLNREPSHWFWALRAITGANPVPESAKGNVAAMTAAWLDWGSSRGYV